MVGLISGSRSQFGNAQGRFAGYRRHGKLGVGNAQLASCRSAACCAKMLRSSRDGKRLPLCFRTRDRLRATQGGQSEVGRAKPISPAQCLASARYRQTFGDGQMTTARGVGGRSSEARRVRGGAGCMTLLTGVPTFPNQGGGMVSGLSSARWPWEPRGFRAAWPSAADGR